MLYFSYAQQCLHEIERKSSISNARYYSDSLASRAKVRSDGLHAISYTHNASEHKYCRM